MTNQRTADSLQLLPLAIAVYHQKGEHAAAAVTLSSITLLTAMAGRRCIMQLTGRTMLRTVSSRHLTCPYLGQQNQPSRSYSIARGRRPPHQENAHRL